MSETETPSGSAPSGSAPSGSAPSGGVSSGGASSGSAPSTIAAAGGGTARRPADEESKFPRGLVVRLVAYLVAGHLFAGFLYLLFHVAQH